jgi:hypothetical protein
VAEIDTCPTCSTLLGDCAGCTDPRSEGTHQACSRQHVTDVLLRSAHAACTDPQWDCTDGACPAWWRGNDRGVDAACERLEKALNGEDDGEGVLGSTRLEALRVRLMPGRGCVDDVRAAVGAALNILQPMRRKPADGDSMQQLINLATSFVQDASEALQVGAPPYCRASAIRALEEKP